VISKKLIIIILISLFIAQCSDRFHAVRIMNKGIRYVNVNDFETAQKYIDRAYAIDTTYLTALFNKATVLGELKKYNESNKILLGLLSKDFKSTEVYFNIASNYRDLSLYDEALVYADSAILSNPNDMGCQNLKAGILGEKEDYDEASEILKEIISKEPNNYEANCMLGFIQAGLKSYDDGLKYLETASKAYPKKYIAYYLKWAIYSFKDEKEMACLNYKLAIKYGYKKEDWFKEEQVAELIRCE
jgi:tetratricopeptide (TPR) repeat protein